nr:hypothetical protein [Tanacetum cinerariifolium]
SYSETTSLVRSVVDVLVVTITVTTTVDANVATGPKTKDAPKTLSILEILRLHVCMGAEVRMRAEHILERKNELEDKCAEKATLLSEKDAEIAHLRSLLSLKEAEAAEAISFHSQLSMVEAANAAKGIELRDLKEKNFALKKEKNVLSERVKTLESVAASKELSRDELNSKVASFESERDCLATQVSTESAFELFKEQVKKIQDEQVGVLSERVAAIDFDLMEMILYMDVEFYPRYLTTIARRRWILSRGLRLVLAKCLSSPEYLSTTGEAIGRAIDKGVNFLILAQLEAKKDASMADIMDLLCLEGPATKTFEASQLQPSLDQLMIPIHRLEDQVIIKETSLAFSLEVAHNHVQRLRRDVAAHRVSLIDSILSLVEPLSTRNLTGEASSFADFTTAVTTALSTYLVLAVLSTEDTLLLQCFLKASSVPLEWELCLLNTIFLSRPISFGDLERLRLGQGLLDLLRACPGPSLSLTSLLLLGVPDFECREDYSKLRRAFAAFSFSCCTFSWLGQGLVDEDKSDFDNEGSHTPKREFKDDCGDEVINFDELDNGGEGDKDQHAKNIYKKVEGNKKGIQG